MDKILLNERVNTEPYAIAKFPVLKWIRIGFFNADPDPVFLSMRIRIQGAKPT
jgi:hypothetical protein